MMFYTGFNYVTTEDCRYRPDRDKQTTKSSSTMVTNLRRLLIIGGVVLIVRIRNN
jgi:hypothetical protein